MRRLLPTALAIAVLVAAFSGVASARLATDAPRGPGAAPFRAPAALPRKDADQAGAYGFRSSTDIASAYQTDAAASGGSSGAGATVTVTAIVLPVVTILVDDSGDVTELVTNTLDRDPRGVLYIVRGEDPAADPLQLDAATWRDARAALKRAGAGTGTIWSS